MHKILLDENVSFQFLSRLKESGFDVSHIGEIKSGMSDNEVLTYAQESGAILISHDSDFSHLIFAGGIQHDHAIVFLRNKGQKKWDLFEKLLKVLKSNVIQGRMMVVITLDQVRVRKWE